MSENKDEPPFFREKFTVTLTYDEWLSVYAALGFTTSFLPEKTLECDLISASIIAQMRDALLR